MSKTAEAGDLLEFWFGAARDRPERIGERMGLWFSPGHEDDLEVRRLFEPVLRLAAGGRLPHWVHTPEGRLALILALDQAPRVIFRKQAQAFAYDGQALALALTGIDAGIDRALGLAERAFFYMPLQHSEDPLVQKRSVEVYRRLAADFPEHAGIARDGFLKFATEHAEIIERFGRYPHRNEVLGRASTTGERRFLEDGPRYGQ